MRRDDGEHRLCLFYTYSSCELPTLFISSISCRCEEDDKLEFVR